MCLWIILDFHRYNLTKVLCILSCPQLFTIMDKEYVDIVTGEILSSFLLPIQSSNIGHYVSPIVGGGGGSDLFEQSDKQTYRKYILMDITLIVGHCRLVSTAQ